MNSKVYKWCAVPECENTSRKSPNKLFMYVPHNKSMREEWLKLARRNPTSVGLNSPIYFCEDHFDLPNDMVNYMEYHVMGAVSQIRMKPDCVPTKFECQSDRTNRTIVIKKSMEHSYCLMEKKLPNDMVNYMEYHVMGIVSQIRMKPDCVPTKFECQADIVEIESAEHLHVPRKQKVQESKQSLSSSMHSTPMNEIKVFCPKCNTDISHTAEAQTNALITRVYHYLEQEYEQLKKLKAKLGPLSKIAQRTALATGVSESTVLEILQEEGINADKAQQPSPKYGRARKRLKQMDSSSHEDTDDNIDFKQAAPLASCSQGTRIEPEVETLVVDKEPVEYNKEEPAVNEQPQVIYVKALSREEPAVKTVRKKSMITPGMKKKQPILYVKALNKQESAVKKVIKKKKITFTPGLKMKQPIIYVKALNDEQPKMNPIPVNVKLEQPDDQMNETESEPVAEPLFVKLESVVYEEEKLVKSQAQRQKEYRQRKKLENSREKKKPKTNAQRQQEFREKQKKNVIGETLDSFLARRKADAERAKRYRENKKQMQKGETLDLNLVRKKNNAERIKIYREKLKSKKDLSSHEDTDHNIEDVGQASCSQDVHAEIDPIAINLKVEPPDDQMNESSRLGEAEVKLEIEIGEEGFS